MSSFRLSKHVVEGIKLELKQFPSKIGQAFLREYETELAKFDKNINGTPGKEPQMDYMPALMQRIAERGARLSRWYDATMEERARKR